MGASESFLDAFPVFAERPDGAASTAVDEHDAEWLDRLMSLAGGHDFAALAAPSVDALLADDPLVANSRLPGPLAVNAFIAIDRLHVGGISPRNSLDTDATARLAASIAEQGILQPLLVRPLGSDYEIIAGARRYEAAKLAGLREVPVVTLAISDREALMVALVENLQREDITALDEAQCFFRLLEEFAWTQDDLARRIGRSRSHISNTLRLLCLPPDVKSLVERGALSAGHARALLNAPDASELALSVIERRLSVRATEALVTRRAPAGSRTRRLSDELSRFEQLLAARLGLTVRIQLTRDGGKATIYYETPDELEAALRDYGRMGPARDNAALAALPAPAAGVPA